WDADGFAALRDAVRADFVDTTVAVLERARAVLAAAYAIEQRLARTRDLALVGALTDIREQLAGLVFPGFLTATGFDQLGEVPRYLAAIDRRLDRLPTDPAR